jgi:hypothetical protein
MIRHNRRSEASHARLVSVTGREIVRHRRTSRINPRRQLWKGKIHHVTETCKSIYLTSYVLSNQWVRSRTEMSQDKIRVPK